MHLVTFKALADFPALVEAHVRSFPDAPGSETPGQAPGMTGWLPVLEQTHAFELDYFQPTLVTILEAKDIIIVAPPERFEPAGQVDLEHLLADLGSARKRSLSLLDGLSSQQWMLSAKMADSEMTLIGLCHLVCANDFRSLALMQDCLQKLNAK